MWTLCVRDNARYQFGDNFDVGVNFDSCDAFRYYDQRTGYWENIFNFWYFIIGLFSVLLERDD